MHFVSEMYFETIELHTQITNCLFVHANPKLPTVLSSQVRRYSNFQISQAFFHAWKIVINVPFTLTTFFLCKYSKKYLNNF